MPGPGGPDQSNCRELKQARANPSSCTEGRNPFEFAEKNATKGTRRRGLAFTRVDRETTPLGGCTRETALSHRETILPPPHRSGLAPELERSERIPYDRSRKGDDLSLEIVYQTSCNGHSAQDRGSHKA